MSRWATNLIVGGSMVLAALMLLAWMGCQVARMPR